MPRSPIAIMGLIAALLGSNAAWLYASLNAGVSYTYLEDSYRTARQTALQAVSLLPEVARPQATRESIIAAALRGQKGEPFDKEGYVWVGELGLQFDSSGALINASPASDPL